jgi:hypothetical protein
MSATREQPACQLYNDITRKHIFSPSPLQNSRGGLAWVGLKIDYIWADAVFINQSDEEEKSTDIFLMASLHSEAVPVLVSLGPHISVFDGFIWLKTDFI